MTDSGLNANGHVKSDSKPIWHSPAWITAIVGVISAFLTIPDIIGNYLSKQQDIELAKQEVIARGVSNDSERQSLEFRIVNNTLAQQGAERIFVLRYLARTLDDEDAKAWAIDEVVRLDKLAQLEEDLAQKTDQIIALQRDRGNDADRGKPSSELSGLQQQLSSLRNELQRLNLEAGIAPASSGEPSEEPNRPINRIIIVPVQSDTISDLRRFQTSSLGFSDVGAHYLITSGGRIENGRPISLAPAVLKGSNSGSIGIYINCPGWSPEGDILICNFQNKQLLVLRELVANLQAEFGIPSSQIVDRGSISSRHLSSTVVEDLNRLDDSSSQ